VPASPGDYRWYFRELPGPIETGDCVQYHRTPLLYIGIAPKRPAASGGRPSQQTLRDRVRCHYSGNAEGLEPGRLARATVEICHAWNMFLAASA
jgi:hypothetical protein